MRPGIDSRRRTIITHPGYHTQGEVLDLIWSPPSPFSREGQCDNLGIIMHGSVHTSIISPLAL